MYAQMLLSGPLLELLLNGLFAIGFGRGFNQSCPFSHLERLFEEL